MLKNSVISRDLFGCHKQIGPSKYAIILCILFCTHFIQIKIKQNDYDLICVNQMHREEGESEFIALKIF